MVVSTKDKWKWPGDWYVDMYGYMFGMEKAGLPHGPGVWGRFLGTRISFSKSLAPPSLLVQ